MAELDWRRYFSATCKQKINFIFCGGFQPSALPFLQNMFKSPQAANSCMRNRGDSLPARLCFLEASSPSSMAFESPASDLADELYTQEAPENQRRANPLLLSGCLLFRPSKQTKQTSMLKGNRETADLLSMISIWSLVVTMNVSPVVSMEFDNHYVQSAKTKADIVTS